MQYSIIQKSQLEGGLRLDSEFYHPEKLEAMEKLSKFGISAIAENFKNVKETFNPLRHRLATTPARVFDLSDVNSFLLEEGKEVAGPDEVGSTKKIFHQSDVLISRLRPYLKEVSFVGFNDVQKLASTEFIVLRKKKDSKFPPQALFAFLITDKVQKILFWSQGGTEHPRFSENLLMDLKLPKISEKIAENIADDVNSAYENYLASRNLYSQAENLLLEELGLKNFEVEDDLSYIVNLSEVKSSHRADAEYFQPKHEKLISKIKSKKEKLGDLVLMKKGIEIGDEQYREEGKLFMRVSSLSKQGLVDKDQKYLSEELYQKLKPDFEPKVGEILLTKDATPGITHVVKEPIEGIISSGILRLKPKNGKIEGEYLALCLNSIIGQMQAERDGGGSVITHWKPEQIKNVLIPILPKPIQQKIADLVQKSHSARKKAKELLDQAKRKVEEMIEKEN